MGDADKGNGGGKVRPRRERKDNAARRRRQILDATFRSIVAHGLARTTLATVAAEAGLSQGVAVFYFKSKRGLLTALLRDLYEAYEAHWAATVDQAGADPAARLTSLVAADFHPAICNRDSLSVWFAFWGEQAFTPQFGEVTRDFDERRTKAIQRLSLELLPGNPARARSVADWVDTLIDGYWLNLQLVPAEHLAELARRSVVDLLCALVPEHAGQLRRAAAQLPD